MVADEELVRIRERGDEWCKLLGRDTLNKAYILL